MPKFVLRKGLLVHLLELTQNAVKRHCQADIGPVDNFVKEGQPPALDSQCQDVLALTDQWR